MNPLILLETRCLLSAMSPLSSEECVGTKVLHVKYGCKASSSSCSLTTHQCTELSVYLDRGSYTVGDSDEARGIIDQEMKETQQKCIAKGGYFASEIAPGCKPARR